MMTPRRLRASMLHPHGYDPNAHRALERIRLPNSITCCVCHIYKAQWRFSANQLNYLREAIFDGRTDFDHICTQEYAKCIACSQSQVVERRCNLCGEFRGLNDFSRNQRSLEAPRCVDCMNDEQNTDPDAELARMQHMGEEEPQSNPVVRMDTSLVLIELDDADAEDDKAAPVCRSSPPFPVRERSPSLIFCRRVDHLNQVDDSRFL